MTKKILIVEYAASTIEIIKEIFAHPMFDLTIVGEGEAAKQQLSVDSFDMMISAAMLPKFHGFNLSQYAKENYPDLNIILMSEIYKGMNYRQQAISQYRADDFFEKPFDKDKFKLRALQLLGISVSDLKVPADQLTQKAKVSDTKKIPTLSQMQKEEEQKDQQRQMSSEDLFGDIIQEVEVSQPSYEIDLNGNGKKPPAKAEQPPGPAQQPVSPETMELPVMTRLMQTPHPGKDSPATQEIKQPPASRDVPPVTQVMQRPPIPPDGKDMTSPEVTQPVDIDIMNLIRGEKKPPPPKEDKKFKQIDDDISRKLEETLSGLGLASSKPRPKSAEKRPAAPPPPKPSTPPTPPSSPPPAQQPPATEVIPTPTFPPPAPPKPKEPADELGGYEILGLIGRGGMAEIYKAKRRGVRGFEKVIALKKILSGYGEDSKYLEMFVDEAKIAAELSHPNIVQIYDLGKKDDYYFIAMEYMFGKDLRLILHKLAETDTQVPEELAIFLTINVLKALDYAHSAKDSRGNRLDIVHRDVSPPNILVSYNGEVKLTDFGVSKASIKMHQTVAGALKGKILYMSPEQARAEETIDFRSDLYSAGIILFELVTGKKLFLGNTEIITLQKVQEGKIDRPSKVKPNISPELEAIILKALEKNPERRYQKASEMSHALESYMAANFDKNPNAIHISHFIYRLFEDEIRKQGLDIQLKPLPFIVSRKPKHYQVPPGTAPETPTVEQQVKPPAPPQPPESDEPLELSQDMMQIPEPPRPEPPQFRMPPPDKDFQPVIEINFDDDKPLPVQEPPKDKIPPKSSQETQPVPQPPLEREKEPVSPPIFSGFESGEKESNKSKKLIIIALVVIVILAAVIIFLLGGGSSDEPGSGLDVQQPPVSGQPAAVGTEPADGSTTPAGDDSAPGLAADTGDTEPSTAEAGESPGEKKLKTGTPDAAQAQPGKKEESKPRDRRDAEKQPKAKEIKEIEKKEIEKKPEPVIPKKKREPKREKEEPAIEKKSKPEKKPEQETKKTGSDTAVKEEPGTEPETKTAEPPAAVEKPPVKEEKPPAPKPTPPPARPVIKEGATLSPSEVDTPATPLSTPSIKVTHRIRRLMMSDQRILVSFLVDHNGNVETVKILKKSNLKRLNSVVEETIKKWKYKPATKDKVKVKVWKNKWVLIKK